MNLHLYLHIPFCESKCHYCAFTSLKQRDTKAYFQALLLDIKAQFALFKIKQKSIQTLFIGGGTPSCVKAHFYEELFEFLQPFLHHKAEQSIEANPNSASKTWLKTMKQYGINRISFGAQSFDDEKLQFLGRIHNQKAIYQAVENAHKAGFENINIDLMYDTYLDTKKRLDFELENLAKLHIKHISAYHLSLEKNTAFWKKKHYKKNAPYLMRHFIKGIENLGFKQYEISNFGQFCKHNLAYWQGKDYMACGLSAVAFKKNQRFYTHKNLQAYIKEPCFRTKEFLDTKALNLEHLFLGLRSCVGIEEKRLSQEQVQKAFLLCKYKKLYYEKQRFFNTNYCISDELVLFLQG